MWWQGGGNGGVIKTFVRYMSNSRKRAPNLRKINPKVPQQEAASIAEALYNVIRQHGPLSVSNTWNHAKEESLILGVEVPTRSDFPPLICHMLKNFDFLSFPEKPCYSLVSC
nr:uncharacterized protein LOC109156984 [Ipomoea batatas]